MHTRIVRAFTISATAAATIAKVFNSNDNEVVGFTPFNELIVMNKSKQIIDIIFDGNAVDNIIKLGPGCIYEPKPNQHLFHSLAIKNTDANFALTGDIEISVEN